ELSDSVTSFQAVAFAHTLDGRLGAATRLIESQLPFTLAPKVPVEVTSTDRIDLPVAVNNNSDNGRSVQLKLAEHKGLDLLAGKVEESLDVTRKSGARRTFSFRPRQGEDKAELRVEGRTDALGDAVRETIRVVPDGFPVAGSSSDLLERSATHKLQLP